MERLIAKPSRQFTTVFRFQDVVNRIFVSYWDNAFRRGEQEEIVIAQHNTNGVAEIPHKSEESERVGPTIDEIADQPQLIRPWIE